MSHEPKRAFAYRTNDDGDLVGVPEEPQRHTPVIHLFDERGRFVGRRCEHCGMLLGPGGRVSEPYQFYSARSLDPIREGKNHGKRVEAAASRIRRKLGSILDFLGD